MNHLRLSKSSLWHYIMIWLLTRQTYRCMQTRSVESGSHHADLVATSSCWWMRFARLLWTGGRALIYRVTDSTPSAPGRMEHPSVPCHTALDQPGITCNERLSPLLSLPYTHTHTRRSAATYSAWALVTYSTVNDHIINQSDAWIVAHNDRLNLWNDQVRCCAPTKWGPSGRSSSAL